MADITEGPQTPDAAGGGYPELLTAEARAVLQGRGIYAVRPLLGGIVRTARGDAYVQLMLRGPLPNEAAEPSRFVVSFATASAPNGIGYEIDVTDFLEAIVRDYFDQRPGETPLATPPVRSEPVAPSGPRRVP